MINFILIESEWRRLTTQFNMVPLQKPYILREVLTCNRMFNSSILQLEIV